MKNLYVPCFHTCPKYSSRLAHFRQWQIYGPITANNSCECSEESGKAVHANTVHTHCCHLRSLTYILRIILLLRLSHIAHTTVANLCPHRALSQRSTTLDMTERSQIESDAALARRLQEEELSRGSYPSLFNASSSDLHREPSFGRQDRLTRSAHESHDDDEDLPMLVDALDEDDDQYRSDNSDTSVPHMSGRPYYMTVGRDSDAIPTTRRPAPYRFTTRSEDPLATGQSSWARRLREQQREHQRRNATTYRSRQQNQSATASGANPYINRSARFPYASGTRDTPPQEMLMHTLNELMGSQPSAGASRGLDEFMEQHQIRRDIFERPSRPSGRRSPQFEYPQPQPSPSATGNNQRRGNTNQQFTNPQGNPLIDAFMQAFNMQQQPPTDRDADNNNSNNNNTNNNNNNDSAPPPRFTATGGMFNFGAGGTGGGTGFSRTFEMGSDGVMYQTNNGERQREYGNGNAPQDIPEFQSMQNMLSMLVGGEGGAGRATGGPGGPAGMMGGGDRLFDIFRSVLPNMTLDGNESYEDLLNLIERMGGDVNRSATEAEINGIASKKFTQDMFKNPNKSSGSTAGSSSSGAAAPPAQEEEKCAVCLGEYEVGEDVKILPCTHMFHSECIDRWLKVNRTCPFCKQSIRPSDGPSE